MNSNNILGNYINFVNTSQQSLHELIALIRQQDDNFQNLLTRPPNTPVNVNTFSYPNSVLRPRRPNIENRRYNNLDSHSSTNYSYPSTNYTNPFNNLTFTTIPNRILPRQANNENQQINNPTTIEILRATETKLYCNIENPVNQICPISQEEFRDNQEIIQIKHCGHIFNKNALLRWFNTRSTCPYCRYDIKNYNTDISNNTNTNNTNNTNSENSDTENDTTINMEIDNNETMVQAISRLIGNNLRDHLENETINFQYTIVGQRIPSPESRDDEN
jgi:hypothetical protein